ncbi:EAL domain-containing protein [Lampropedia puyangensis]|uniref:EAL domain-containing protein n=1 Tax=Lampropedia puyangensis TaxID=1330072 RepID=A0A4S8FA18_9BURK|nr:EAL domain-containing protein [Lampropedia puyangensis]THU04107.1 EAL domain-containing protein [Lampropedia puyangensis]
MIHTHTSDARLPQTVIGQPEGFASPLKKQVGFWLFAAIVLACLGTGLLMLNQGNNAREQLLQQAQQEMKAMQFAYALQSSAQAYGRFLFNVQNSLTGDPEHDGRSLVDQWNTAIANPEFASTHILRMIAVEQDAGLGGKIKKALLNHHGGIEVRAFTQSQGITLVALPAADIESRNDSTFGLVIAVDLRFSDWLREVQRLAETKGVEVHAFVGDTASPSSDMQPSLRWNNDQLHIAMQILGQRIELIFSPTGPIVAVNPISQALPWGLIVTGLVVLLAWIFLQRLRENELVFQGLRYRDYAYKGWMRYFAFVKHPLVPTAEIDRNDGYFHSLSPRFSQLLGYSQEAMQRLTIASITHPDDLEKLSQPEILRSQDQDYSYERISDLRLQHSLGHPVWVDLLIMRYKPANGKVAQHSLTARDLVILLDQSQPKTLQNQLHRRIQKNEQIFEQLPVGLCITDAQMQIVFMNARFKEYSNWYGPSPETLDQWWAHSLPDAEQRASVQDNWGQQVSAAIARNGMLEALELNLESDQSMPCRIVELSGIILDDQMVLTLVDLTAHKKAEEDIRQLAFYDITTGLPNRRLLLDRLEQATITSSHHEWYGALLLLNLDHLRTIRDDKGPILADAVLKETALRLRKITSEDQTVARTDTGEFAILLSALAYTEDDAIRRCEEIGHKIIQAIETPFIFDGRSIYPGIYLGTTLFNGVELSAEELLSRTNIALYQSKQKGLDTPHFFDPQMQASVRARVALEEDIRAGITMSEFVLYFQPQFNGQQLIGAEVLLRWRHGSGFVSPDKFITTAEQSNLILPLGNWVLSQACKQLAEWAKRPETAHLTLSVNVSPKQFKHDQFVDIVLQAITSSGAPANRLVIELTEGVLLENIENAIERMTQLRAYGVSFSLDDFGTGYSSLSYLQRLPLTEVKIDRSFLHDIDSNASGASIVRTIVSLGHSMGLKVVAEGIESQTQIDYLKTCDCFLWQGYFIGEPQPIESLEKLLVQTN